MGQALQTAPIYSQSYHGRPARGFAGSATTLYTSYFACDWMVCSQNKFGEKAAFSLDLRVPRGMTSLSVGSMIARRPGPDGSEIHSWKAPRPYSAYLYGFAVGRFTRVMIVALARKLLIALWQFSSAGAVPKGALLKAG